MQCPSKLVYQCETKMKETTNKNFGGKSFLHSLLLWQTIRFRERSQSGWNYKFPQNPTPADSDWEETSIPQEDEEIMEQDHPHLCTCVCDDNARVMNGHGDGGPRIKKIRRPRTPLIASAASTFWDSVDFQNLSLWLGCGLVVLISIYVSYAACTPFFNQDHT